MVITMAEQHNSLNEQARLERLALEDHRKALSEIAYRIRDQMSAELNGQAARASHEDLLAAPRLHLAHVSISTAAAMRAQVLR